MRNELGLRFELQRLPSSGLMPHTLTRYQARKCLTNAIPDIRIVVMAVPREIDLDPETDLEVEEVEEEEELLVAKTQNYLLAT